MSGRGRPDTRARAKKRQAKANEASEGTTKRGRVDASTDTSFQPVETVQLCPVEDREASHSQNGNEQTSSVVDFSTVMRDAGIISRSNHMLIDSRSTVGSVDAMRTTEDDLSVHVPLAIRQKIWAHQYINLALLLKGNVELSEVCNGGALRINAEGQIESTPKKVTERVSTIEKWTDAFMVFMAIYLSRYQDKAVEMLKYMSVIREAASRHNGFGWRTYDEQFRLRQAVSVRSWAHINADLWLRVMTLQSNVTSSTPQVPMHNSSKFPCFDFNRGSCHWPACRFGHFCSACKLYNHGQWNCSRAQLGVQRTNNSFRGARGRGGSRSRGGYTNK